MIIILIPPTIAEIIVFSLSPKCVYVCVYVCVCVWSEFYHHDPLRNNFNVTGSAPLLSHAWIIYQRKWSHKFLSNSSYLCFSCIWKGKYECSEVGSVSAIMTTMGKCFTIQLHQPVAENAGKIQWSLSPIQYLLFPIAAASYTNTTKRYEHNQTI